MKPLIFFDPFPRTQAMVFTPEVRETLGRVARLQSHFGSRAPDELVEKVLPEVEVIVGQTAMPKRRLDRAPKLRAILNVKANWEPDIDYLEAHRRGIYVLSAAPAMAPAVAEACVGYAIALSRRFLDVERDFRRATERYGIAANGDAYSLYGANVGFVGFGNLARELLPLLTPFGCRVTVHDPWLSRRFLEVHGTASADLDTVLGTSRFLFILAGHTSENEGFLDREKLEKIPHDASVVLVSRAAVVDFEAFVDMASTGRFRAAVDVFPEEPVPAQAPFRSAANILFTSHVAGGLHASYERIRDMMLDDIQQILAGYAPLRMQRADPHLAAMMRSR
ncbi:MAG: NAD(P)-dependent oxidoreductase [Gammaproteobacteria bacterium]